jgi:hypothetical protein
MLFGDMATESIIFKYPLLLLLLLLCEVDHQIQNTEYGFLVVTLLGRYHPGRLNFSHGIQGIGARLLENPKFVSWARIRARLGKSQFQGPITCPLVDGLMICNWVIYIRVFEFFVLYILYYFSISIYFLFRVYLPFHVIHIGVFSNVHKILLYLYIFSIMYLKCSIDIWVQSRKEDQILRLDLNPY